MSLRPKNLLEVFVWELFLVLFNVTGEATELSTAAEGWKKGQFKNDPQFIWKQHLLNKDHI